MEEIWKDMCEFDNLYQISSLGNVRSKKRTITFKDGRKKEFPDTNLIASDNGNGYMRVTISYFGKRKKYFIHRLVAKYFIPNPNNYNQVNHINFKKDDNNIENLEWCSAKMNMLHSKHQKRNNKTYTKDEIIISMINDLRDGYSIPETARRNNVSYKVAYRLSNNKTFHRLFN